MKLPSVAIAMTIKNEAAILRKNILYHKKLGVDKFYIFDDGSIDNTRETVEDLDYVCFQDSVDGDQYKSRNELKIFTDNWKTHHPARQSLNVLWASEHARSKGYNWIISLDADELICLNHEHQKPGELKKFFSSIPLNTETVLFKNLEVVQRLLSSENIFLEETLFKQNTKKIKRKMWDPIKKEYFNIYGYYGQGRGKSAFNLEIEAKHGTVHKFVGLKDDKNLNTYLAPQSLLHYFFYDFDDFYRHTKNYVKLKNKRMHGSIIERQKQVWRDFVNNEDISKEEAKKYYQEHILYNNDEISKGLKNKIFGIFNIEPTITKITAVRNFHLEHLS